jgi:ribosomal protein L11 methyltransferase
MKDFYYQLVVKVSAHYALFRDFLTDTLPIGFEEADEGFIIRSEEDLSTIAWGIEQFAEALQKALGEQINIETQLTREPNSDWIQKYKDSVSAVEIGSFYIHPSWEPPKEGKINIHIEPSFAFGTGHHATTASCIEAIEAYVKEGDSVLDAGCGSGILSICAMKFGAVADGCDTDEDAIQNAQMNAADNNITYNTLWVGSVSKTQMTYDVVVANIVADVLEFLANDIKNVLKAGGITILSGILQEYETKVLDAYKDLEQLERIQKDEWVTLILKKKKEE